VRGGQPRCIVARTPACQHCTTLHAMRALHAMTAMHATTPILVCARTWLSHERSLGQSWCWWEQAGASVRCPGQKVMSTELGTATRDPCPGYVDKPTHVLTCSWVSGPRPSDKVIRPAALVLQSPRTSLSAPWFLPALSLRRSRRQPPTFWAARAAGPSATRDQDSNPDTEAERPGEPVVPTEAARATRNNHG
jgi:hypothetical protein